MKQAIQPYLHFDDNCKEAMQYYHSLFGGELEIMPISESEAKEHFPPELQHQILHATLRNGDFIFMASDMCGQGDLNQGNSVQLNLTCESLEEINNLYKKLSEGGQIWSELKEEFWGDMFAMIQDKYGVRWMLSYTKQ